MPEPDVRHHTDPEKVDSHHFLPPRFPGDRVCNRCHDKEDDRCEGRNQPDWHKYSDDHEPSEVLEVQVHLEGNMQKEDKGNNNTAQNRNQDSDPHIEQAHLKSLNKDKKDT